MILYMILFTHAVIIIWFTIEREEKWPHPSSAALTTSSSIAGGDDAIMSSSISIEQALANHANSSNTTHAALETILARRNNLSSQNLQLWNHLRKQRHNYSLASNDVKGRGPSVISYGQSLRHSRRGRKSPMTRTWMCPRLRQVALGVVQEPL